MKKIQIDEHKELILSRDHCSNEVTVAIIEKLGSFRKRYSLVLSESATAEVARFLAQVEKHP